MKLNKQFVIATLSASIAALALLARHPETRRAELAQTALPDTEAERWFI